MSNTQMSRQIPGGITARIQPNNRMKNPAISQRNLNVGVKQKGGADCEEQESAARDAQNCRERRKARSP